MEIKTNKNKELNLVKKGSFMEIGEFLNFEMDENFIVVFLLKKTSQNDLLERAHLQIRSTHSFDVSQTIMFSNFDYPTGPFAYKNGLIIASATRKTIRFDTDEPSCFKIYDSCNSVFPKFRVWDAFSGRCVKRVSCQEPVSAR